MRDETCPEIFSLLSVILLYYMRSLSCLGPHSAVCEYKVYVSFKGRLLFQRE